MANSDTIKQHQSFPIAGGLTATIASLITLAYTISGFIQNVNQQQPSVYYSGYAYAGYSVMAWLGVLALAFGWSGIAYTIERKHFALSVVGISFISASCIVEARVLYYIPPTNGPPMISPYYSALPLIFMQLLFSLAGIILVAASRHQFS
ncbi:MAG: hypothetical protein ABSA75_03820 [Candidatus Bathyarchaeia archaeon]|jgi:hypothetical protein